MALAGAASASATALWLFFSGGYLLYYGDAQAHLNIARRVIDSRTPGYDQIGTVWLPLPHWLMMPFVRNVDWWRSGLAGGIPAAASFTLACLFLFALVRRLTSSSAAAFTAMALFALNPNLLYLQSTPMTEPFFFAALFPALYFLALARDTRSLLAAAAAGLFACAGTLVRYEAWFLIPFMAACLAWRRPLHLAAVFAFLASLGPLYWLAHNYYYYSDPLEFYRGPYSAKAIYERALATGMARYAGDHDWAKAWLYFRSAAQLTAGWPLLMLGLAGAVAALWKRMIWPLILLALLPAFYLWSMYSSGTPIFVPHLWPSSYYNTRYGLAAFPLLTVAASALVAACPSRFRAPAALAVVLAAISPWLLHPRLDNVICWKESQVNSEARRAWTAQAAAFLRDNYRGGGIAAPFGDLTGIFPLAGIPLAETLHEGNAPYWQGALARPDLFLREEWAVAIAADPLATAILKSQRKGPRYDRVKMIYVKGAPVVEIYRRGSQLDP